MKMGKQNWKPGNMVYPLPAALISCGDINGKMNLLTVSWLGTICTDPPMCYISVRPERFSHDLIKQSGEFVINLTTSDIAKATDWCGLKSGLSILLLQELWLIRMELIIHWGSASANLDGVL